MTDSMKRESIRLNAHMEKAGISFDDLQKATGKRPHYLHRVLTGHYPVSRPVCEAVDKLTGSEVGTTFSLCIGEDS